MVAGREGLGQQPNSPLALRPLRREKKEGVVRHLRYRSIVLKVLLKLKRKKEINISDSRNLSKRFDFIRRQLIWIPRILATLPIARRRWSRSRDTHLHSRTCSSQPRQRSRRLNQVPSPALRIFYDWYGAMLPWDNSFKHDRQSKTCWTNTPACQKVSRN